MSPPKKSKSLTGNALLVASLVVLASLLLFACGDAGKQVAGIKPKASTSTTAANSNAPNAAPTKAAAVKVASTNLGDVLVTSSGMTLYIFEPDGTDGPTCVDACAQTWPPLTTVGEPTGTNITPGILATVQRKDGSLQVTAKGHPLYQYSGDSEPGDTNGQGIGGIWFVLSNTGRVVRHSPGSINAPTTQPSTTPGY